MRKNAGPLLKKYYHKMRKLGVSEDDARYIIKEINCYIPRLLGDWKTLGRCIEEKGLELKCLENRLGRRLKCNEAEERVGSKVTDFIYQELSLKRPGEQDEEDIGDSLRNL
jgi:hypothetical protein